MVSKQSADSRLTQVSIRQAGAFTRKQAVKAGFSGRQIEGRLRSRVWLRLFGSVYAMAAVPITWMTWAWAGTLSGGPGTALIGRSAAASWLWLPQTWPVTLAVPPSCRRQWPGDKLRVYNLTVPDDDLVSMQGLPVTNKLRTAVDVAHLMPLAQAQELIDRLLVRGDVDLSELTGAIEVSRRSGSRQARQLIT
jgi:hypothetical protein